MDGFEGILHLLKILNFISRAKEYTLLVSPGITNAKREADTKRRLKVYANLMKNFKRKTSIYDLA
jgi:hypothetical protein